MTDNHRQLVEKHAAQLSPTIAAEGKLVDAMKRVPICVVCTSARWYKLEDAKGVETLECFCTQFRGVMYGRGKDAVTACDARVDALNNG